MRARRLYFVQHSFALGLWQSTFFSVLQIASSVHRERLQVLASFVMVRSELARELLAHCIFAGSGGQSMCLYTKVDEA